MLKSLQVDDLKEKKILIFADDLNAVSNIKKVISELRNKGSENFVVFVSNFFLDRKLKEYGVPCKYIEDYVETDDFLGMYQHSVYLAENWFKTDNREDITEYKNISLGSILQREMTQYFMQLLMNITVARKVIKKEAPHIIILCNETDEKRFFVDNEKSVTMSLVFSFLAKSGGFAIVNCERRKVSIFARKLKKLKLQAFKLEEKKITIFKKQFSVNLPAVMWKIVIAMLLCKKIIGTLPNDERRQNILFSSESGINYIGWNLLEWLEKKEMYSLLVLGPVFRSHGLRLTEIIRFIYPGTFSHKTLKGGHYKKCMPKYVDSILTYNNYHFGELVKDDFGWIYQQVFPLLVGNVEYYQKALKKKSIKLVISSDDTTRNNKALILSAKSIHIPTLVVQHGIPGHYLGYFPLSADKILVMGEFSKKWFLKNKVLENRIAVTGIPRFEERNKKKGGDFLKDGFILFAAETGNDLGYMCHWLTYKDNEKIFSNLLETMKMLKNERLIIKLRPGDMQHDFYQGLINKNSCNNIDIVTNEDPNILIQKCKILITTYSTMAVEGILKNKPIIILSYIFNREMLTDLYRDNLLSSETLIPFLKYKAAIEVSTPDSLPKTITTLLDNNDKKTYLQKGRKEFIKEYCCDMEGASAHERIDKLINKMLIP